MKPFTFRENSDRYYRSEIPEATPLFKGIYHSNNFEKVGKFLWKPIWNYRKKDIKNGDLNGLEKVIHTIYKIALIPVCFLGSILKQVGESYNPGFATWRQYKVVKTNLFDTTLSSYFPRALENVKGKTNEYVWYPFFARFDSDFNNAVHDMEGVLKNLTDKKNINFLNKRFQTSYDIFESVKRDIPNPEQMNIKALSLFLQKQLAIINEILPDDSDKIKMNAYFEFMQQNFDIITDGIKPLYAYKDKMKKAYETA